MKKYGYVSGRFKDRDRLCITDMVRVRVKISADNNVTATSYTGTDLSVRPALTIILVETELDKKTDSTYRETETLLKVKVHDDIRIP